MDKLYSATVNGKSKIDVFDVNKGVRAYSINLGNITIINGPVITKDKLTIVVKDSSGKTKGKVFTLKTGVLSYSFVIQN
jgi:hypothetical protein